MSGFVGPSFLAARGSTGNNTHTSIGVAPNASKLCALLVVEAVGTTITAKVQGTVETSDINDASANWFDLAVVEAGSDTTVTSITKTVVGGFPMYLSLGNTRF